MTSPTRRTDKRTRITEAAIEVFAERGFSQARVSDVARRAGVADGTIYLYFKSKDDLLLSVFEEKMDFMLEGLREALVGCDDPPEQIRRFTRFHFEQVRTNRAAAEVLQLELRMSRKFLKEYRPEKLWSYLGMFRSILLEGQRRGVFRGDVDPFIAMWSFFGAMDELGVQWVLARNSSRFPLDEAAEQVAEIFLRGMAVNAPAPQGVSPNTTEVP
jgi:TetR/AcrR family fatty acid metabolism transcriptional regulator